MRRYIKHAFSTILVPFARWYLRKDRQFKYNGIQVLVRSGVFHPGFFYSTKFLLTYLKTHKLSGKTFLEVGSGTGLISIYAAKQGAIVTASDISATAVENTSTNATLNNVEITVLHSDLFTAINVHVYDWIVINPPYYKKMPVTESDFAWYCGEHFEYFHTLFSQLPDYCNEATQCIMVLTKGCDIESIKAIAKKNAFELELLQEKHVFFDEKDYLFRVRSNSSL
ncbi:MAG TPA: methyltransferase [Chryseosolibacter sp.]